MTTAQAINENTLYAIIDLETTGTNFVNGDRIIQFGCALMRKGEIIESISQLINPDMPIPPAIQQLTGITPKTLVTAPYFEEVAQTLRSFIEGAVIVAHNVNFDYPFLSASFESVGQEPLDQLAVDTVELSQILLPTAPSFRLADLTARFSITHEHPHRADSDAIATAKLLWRLRERLQSLPGTVQSQLKRIGANGLTRDTGVFIAGSITSRPLSQEEVLVGRFVLKRPQDETTPLTDALPAYPVTLADKKKLMTPRYRMRAQQAHLMDKIYEHATSSSGPLFVEAGTGLGKTFGYLLPYLSLATPEKPLVIATPTTVLQKQLLERDIPALEELIGTTVVSRGFQSARHYIDLDAFDASLDEAEPNHLTRLLQLRILVWLCETETGDLSELRLTNYQAPLFQVIRHSGISEPNGRYAEFDFAKRELNRGRARLIVTNHAYLAHHYAALTKGDKPYLVIDEAQHFADNVARANEQTGGLVRAHKLLSRLRDLMSSGDHPLLTIYEQTSSTGFLFRSLFDQIDKLQSRVAHFQEEARARLLTALKNDEKTLLIDDDAAGEKEELSAFRGELARKIEALAEGLSRLRFDAVDKRFTPGERAQLRQACELQEKLLDLKGALNASITTDPITVTMRKDAVRTLDYRWNASSAQKEAQELLAQFTNPVFIGATLTTSRSFDFLTKELGYGEQAVEATARFRGPFHYRDQAKVFIDSSAPNAQTVASGSYADYLADTIARLADNKHQTLALFNSLETIKKVYERLMRLSISDHKEILAQGITGTPEKIAKRFALSDNALLLGASSFFEGVDYPDKQLEIVILTRLPFDSPDSPESRARELLLKSRGEDPFVSSALPRATLKFRQAFGRLIRTENDRGIFVVLDSRLSKTKYGRKMQRSLPNLKPYVFDTQTLIEQSLAWLDANSEKDAKKETKEKRS